MGAPISAVVPGFASWQRIVGNLVLDEPGIAEQIHGHFKKIGIPVLILGELVGLKLVIKFGVLLIGEAIGGDVLGSESDRSLQGGLPLSAGLGGNGEHQIEADVIKTRLPKNVVSLFGLIGGMNAPKHLEDGIIPGLHSHADAIDPKLAK